MSSQENRVDHGPEAIAAIETHISEVFLGSDRVYKRLKPVALPFLDFSDSATRIRAAEREVELNQRMSPDVYLGTADVIEFGQLVDRMIVMKRLPRSAGFTKFAHTAGFGERLEEVARAIAAFHSDQEALRGAPAAPASVDAMQANWNANFDALAAHATDTIGPAELEATRANVSRYLTGRRPLFEARESDGWVRDGHGDLRCEHVFCLPDGPRFIDCLAFADQYRIADVLNDVAFLAMDLHRLVGPLAALRLLAAYDRFTNERHPASLAHHFVAYRASVRAKIAAIRLAQGDLTAASLLQGYHRLMADHLDRSSVRLVVVGGAPGVGKSTVAEGIASELGYIWLRSDEIRKNLAGLSGTEHAFSEPDTGIYTPEFTRTVYAEMLREATMLLEMGESVVLDASWASADDRDNARQVAATTSSELVEIECVLDAAIAKERIARRLSSLQNPSDATPQIADHVRSRFDGWPEATELSTGGSVDQTIDDGVRIVCGRAEQDIDLDGSSPDTESSRNARFTELVLFAEASIAPWPNRDEFQTGT